MILLAQQMGLISLLHISAKRKVLMNYFQEIYLPKSPPKNQTPVRVWSLTNQEILLPSNRSVTMALPLITPPPLKSGDTIAFISPSARLNETLPTPLSRSVDFFKKQGYSVKVIYSPTPTTSALPKYLAKARHVANEVHEAFLDDAVTCIISTM